MVSSNKKIASVKQEVTNEGIKILTKTNKKGGQDVNIFAQTINVTPIQTN